MKFNLTKIFLLVLFFAFFMGQGFLCPEEAFALEIHPLINADEIVVVEEPFTVEEFERVLLYMVVTDRFELDIPYEDPMKINSYNDDLINTAIVNNFFDAWYNVGAKYPEYFELFRRFTYETYETTSKKVVLKLLFSSQDFANDEVVEMKHSLLEETENIVSNLIETKQLTKEMTEREKAKVFYEWLAVNNSYDLDYKRVSFNGYGLVTNNTGVCSAYTSVYNLMLKMVGISEVEGIVGTAGIGDDIEGHIWTRANLDGEILYIDSTWGDPVPDSKGYCNFSYFAVDEDFLSGNYHYWDKERYERLNNE